SSRYVSYSIFLPIALINLVPLICSDVLSTESKNLSSFFKYLPSALASALIILQIYSLPTAFQNCQDRYFQQRLGKGALLLLNIIPDNPEIPHLGLPMPDRMVETANAVNRLGYLHPPLIVSNNAQQIQRQNTGNDGMIGTLDGFEKTPSGQW